jgi:hypothetical protein
MESEGSLPCSQEPATGPYPEPDESNLQSRTLFLSPILILWRAPDTQIATAIQQSDIPSLLRNV